MNIKIFAMQDNSWLCSLRPDRFVRMTSVSSVQDVAFATLSGSYNGTLTNCTQERCSSVVKTA